MNGRRRALRAGWIVALLAVLGIAFTIVANLVTSAMPWAWTHDLRLLMPVGAVLAVAMVVLAVLDRGASDRSEPDPPAPPEATVTGAGAAAGGHGVAAGAHGAATGSGQAAAGDHAQAAQTIYNIGHVDSLAVPAAPEVPAPSPGASGRLVGDLPGEPVAFQDRADLSAELAAVLGAGGLAVVCPITGGRGVGKTQLAAAYARGRLADGCPLVAWVDGETTGGLLTGLAAVAEHLGVADPEGDSASSARRLRDHLASRTEDALLVIDNATGLDQVRELVPPAGACRVVVTTTDLDAAELGRPVRVGGYDRAQSIAFLTARTELSDEVGADRVAAAFDDLPLALAQAAPVIYAQRLSYDEYLDRLATVPVADVLTAGSAQPYPKGAAEAILLSLATVEQAAPGAGALLTTIAVLSPDGVALDLLGEVPDDPAVTAALRYSVLTWAGATGRTVHLHRLVARVLRDRATADGTLDAALDRAAGLLETAYDLVPREETWSHRDHYRDLPDHVDALWDHTVAAWIEEPPPDSVSLLLYLRFKALDRMTELADLERAQASGSNLLADCEYLLAPDEQLLSLVLDGLARAHRLCGDVGHAIPLLERALAEDLRVLGPDHQDALASRNNLAHAYREAGDLNQARSLYGQILIDSERVLGPEHPGTLTARSNLATVTYDCGDLDQALALHKKTRTDRERVLGPDHPSTLVSCNNLASAYQGAGYLDQALALFEQTLTDRERILSPDHPDTLLSRNNLASAHQVAGDFDRAISLYERTLADCERILGSGHPTTNIVRANLERARQERYTP